MNFGIHWKLGNIPRHNNLWLQAIADSPSQDHPTISLDICPNEHVGSTALELPEPDPRIRHSSTIVTPRTSIEGAREAFLTRALAGLFVEYKNEVIRFGREWAPDSLAFRELAFALVSIVSGQSGFHPSFPVPRRGKSTQSDRWFKQDWAGDTRPQVEFGSLSHQRPASGRVAFGNHVLARNELVSLTLVVDGATISKAVAWGISHARENFQIIVMPLFKVALAEVSTLDGEPIVTHSDNLNLSPLRPSYCLSTHPRERPVLKPGMEIEEHAAELLIEEHSTGTAQKLRNNYPGLAALVDFFNVTASRHAALFNGGRLPQEIYDQILDLVDCQTWRACPVVSRNLRELTLRKFRLSGSKMLFDWSSGEPGESHRSEQPSFGFQDMQTR